MNQGDFNMKHKMDRRHFLRTSALAGGAALALNRAPFISELKAKTGPNTGTSTVGLASGPDHVDNIFQALQPLKNKIAAAIGNRPVLIKPNCVSHGTTALADTPVQCIEGILEFLKSIGKTDVTVAENCPGGLTMTAFSSDGYFALLNKYPVRFKELSQEGSRPFLVWNSGTWDGTAGNYRPGGNPADGVLVAKMLLKPRNYFVISACRPKTHNYQIATLGYKNMGMGCALENQTIYTPGQSGWTDIKQHMHWAAGNAGSNTNNYKSGCQDLCDTLYMLAKWLAPDMEVIDAYQGMEGSGPTGGTAVNQQLAIAGLDWLAVDRVAVEIMNVATAVTQTPAFGDSTAWTDGGKTDSWPWPMYPAALNYCGQYQAQDGSTLGQYDLSKIAVLGPSNRSFSSIQNAITTQHANSATTNYYGLHPSIANELVLGYGLREPANTAINS